MWYLSLQYCAECEDIYRMNGFNGNARHCNECGLNLHGDSEFNHHMEVQHHVRLAIERERILEEQHRRIVERRSRAQKRCSATTTRRGDTFASYIRTTTRPPYDRTLCCNVHFRKQWHLENNEIVKDLCIFKHKMAHWIDYNCWNVLQRRLSLSGLLLMLIVCQFDQCVPCAEDYFWRIDGWISCNNI